MSDSLQSERSRPRALSTVNNLGVAPADPSRQFEDSADGILAAFKRCIYATTENACESAWQRLQAEFSQQQAIIQYFDRTYWPWRDQWAEFSVRNNRNLGIRSTARAEASHRTLKRHLASRTSSLYHLHRAIFTAFTDVNDNYIHQIARQKRSALPDHLREPLFSHLRYNISLKGLKLIQEQLQVARSGSPRDPCTKTFSRQYGLPCAHMLEEAVLEKEELTLADVDPHWHLHRDEVYAIHALSERVSAILTKYRRLARISRGGYSNGIQWFNPRGNAIAARLAARAASQAMMLCLPSVSGSERLQARPKA